MFSMFFKFVFHFFHFFFFQNRHEACDVQGRELVAEASCDAHTRTGGRHGRDRAMCENGRPPRGGPCGLRERAAVTGDLTLPRDGGPPRATMRCGRPSRIALAALELTLKPGKYWGRGGGRPNFEEKSYF